MWFPLASLKLVVTWLPSLGLEPPVCSVDLETSMRQQKAWNTMYLYLITVATAPQSARFFFSACSLTFCSICAFLVRSFLYRDMCLPDHEKRCFRELNMICSVPWMMPLVSKLGSSWKDTDVCKGWWRRWIEGKDLNLMKNCSCKWHSIYPAPSSQEHQNEYKPNQLEMSPCWILLSTQDTDKRAIQKRIQACIAMNSMDNTSVVGWPRPYWTCSGFMSPCPGIEVDRIESGWSWLYYNDLRSMILIREVTKREPEDNKGRSSIRRVGNKTRIIDVEWVGWWCRGKRNLLCHK